MRLARDPGHQDEGASGQHADPIRWVVQAMLVVYLSPVILAVLLVGGAAIAAAQCVGASRGVARWMLGTNGGAGRPIGPR